MVKRSRSKSRRKSRTRGWAKAAPKRTTVRRAQLKKCGSKCYLSPKKLKFPICPKGSCKVSCKGAQSAYIRARQWKHSKVAKKAARILKRKCGHTVGPKRRSKSRRRKSKRRSKKRRSKSKKKIQIQEKKKSKSKRRSKVRRKRR